MTPAAFAALRQLARAEAEIHHKTASALIAQGHATHHGTRNRRTIARITPEGVAALQAHAKRGNFNRQGKHA